MIMHIEHRALLKDATWERLHNTGLKIEIGSCEGALNPQELELSPSVMHDIDFVRTGLSSKLEQLHLTEQINKVCTENLGCTERDVLWQVIYDNTNGAVTRSQAVIITKADWLSHVNQTVFTDEMEVEVHEQLDEDIDMYCAWTDDRVYYVQMLSDGVGDFLANYELYNHHDYIYNGNNHVDKIVNKMIDEIVEYINSDKSKALEVTIDAPTGTSFNENSTKGLLQRVSQCFGFTPIIGNSHIADDGKSMTCRLWVDSIPDFASLLTKQKKAVKVNKVKNPTNLAKVVADGVEDVATFFIDTIGENKSYDEWQVETVAKLIQAVLSPESPR